MWLSMEKNFKITIFCISYPTVVIEAIRLIPTLITYLTIVAILCPLVVISSRMTLMANFCQKSPIIVQGSNEMLSEASIIMLGIQFF